MILGLLKKVTGIGASKMVIIVRTDLNMGRGKIASQVAHAAILLYQSALESSNPHLNSWLRYGQPKIVLKVDKNCEQILKEVYQEAAFQCLNVSEVHDAGKTQVDTGTLTCIGIGPNLTEDIDKLTNGLKLL